MKTNRFQILTLLLAISSMFVLCSCGSKTEKESDPRQGEAGDSTALSLHADSIVIEFAGVDSQTVFDLLKDSHQVEYKPSALGVFVTAIDSIENSANACWIYSVNDSIPPVACDRYVTRNGDLVRWHLRKSRQ